jgi:hypothetical protein
MFAVGLPLPNRLATAAARVEDRDSKQGAPADANRRQLASRLQAFDGLLAEPEEHGHFRARQQQLSH